MSFVLCVFYQIYLVSKFPTCHSQESPAATPAVETPAAEIETPAVAEAPATAVTEEAAEAGSGWFVWRYPKDPDMP